MNDSDWIHTPNINVKRLEKNINDIENHIKDMKLNKENIHTVLKSIYDLLQKQNQDIKTYQKTLCNIQVLLLDNKKHLQGLHCNKCFINPLDKIICDNAHLFIENYDTD